MPIPIIEKNDLNALAWHLKQVFNIAIEQGTTDCLSQDNHTSLQVGMFMITLKNFTIVHKKCGKEAIIDSIHESYTHNDVDPDIIMYIRCEHCKVMHKERL